MNTATELEFCEVEVRSVLAAQVSSRSAPDPASIKPAMEKAFQTLADFLARHGIPMAGQPRAIYTSYGPDGVSFTVAVPVAAAPGDNPAVTIATLAGGPAFRFTHHGPYQMLARTYGHITEFLKAQGWISSEADWARYMPMWEEYLNPPETTPEADLLTYIYLPQTGSEPPIR